MYIPKYNRPYEENYTWCITIKHVTVGNGEANFTLPKN